MIARSSTARRLLVDRSGASAVEFALILPLMLLILFGGYAICETVAISRKVTITTRALADLTSQYPSVATSDLATILSASAQIIAPFTPAPLTMRLSEISTNAVGTAASVTWSVGSNATPYQANTPFVLPTQMYVPDASYILSEVTYTYTPAVAYGIHGPFPVSDRIFMVPRTSQSIPCTNC